MKTLIYLFVVAMVFTGCKTNRGYTSSVQRNAETTPVEEVVTQEEEETVVEEKVPVRSEEVKLTHGTEMMKYCVILGSFVNEQYAVDLRNNLMEMGFTKSCIMQNNQGMYRVAAVCFSNEAQARAELIKIRHQYSQYADAWLLITK